MPIRPRPLNPSSPSSLLSISLLDALSLASAALSPWLNSTSSRPKHLPRELRTVANTLSRLRSALAAAAASASTLFDRVAASDAKAALIELRDIATRARAASAARPRIRLDRRPRRQTRLFYTPSGTALASISTPTSPVPNNDNSASSFTTEIPFPAEERKHVEAVANRLDTLIQVALWKARRTLSIERHQNQQHISDIVVESNINSISNSNSNDTDSCDQRVHRTTSCVPVPVSVVAGRLAHRRAHHTNPSSGSSTVTNGTAILRSRLGGRHGRVFSNGDMPNDVRPIFARPFSPSSPSSLFPTSLSPSSTSSSPPEVMPSSSTSTSITAATPWEFSPIENPITPLRSRGLYSVPDGQSVLAMWRGQRVTVKIIRDDHCRFRREADYLHALGQCPNIPALLGAHWEHAPPSSSLRKHKHKLKHICSHHHYNHNNNKNHLIKLDNTSNDKNNKINNDDVHFGTSVGYLVREASNGVSLDKLVRQSKLSDTVTKIRLLERIVAALVFAQKLNPLITHQDLHPGNILLVPSSTPNSTLSIHSSTATSLPTSVPADPAPIFITNEAGQSPYLSHKPAFARSVTNSTRTTTTTTKRTTYMTNITGTSIQKTPSHSAISEPFANSISNTTNEITALAQSSSSQTPVLTGGEPADATATAVAAVFPHATPALNMNNDVSVSTSVATQRCQEEHLQYNFSQLPTPTNLDHALMELDPLQRIPEEGTSLTYKASRPAHVSFDGEPTSSISPESPQHPGTPVSPTIRLKTATASLNLARSTLSVENDHSSSGGGGKSIGGNGHVHGVYSHGFSSSNLAAFTVKVMDFASAVECEGTRQNASWEKYDIWAGYCPPEKVTKTMRQKSQARREEQLQERFNIGVSNCKGTNVAGSYVPKPTDTIHMMNNSDEMRTTSHINANSHIDYNDNLMAYGGRDRHDYYNTVNNHPTANVHSHRERPKTAVTDERNFSSLSGANAALPHCCEEDTKSATGNQSADNGDKGRVGKLVRAVGRASVGMVTNERNNLEGEHDSYLMTPKANSNAHQQAYDSETYALFGDDHEYLGNLAVEFDLDKDDNKRGATINCDISREKEIVDISEHGDQAQPYTCIPHQINNSFTNKTNQKNFVRLSQHPTIRHACGKSSTSIASASTSTATGYDSVRDKGPLWNSSSSRDGRRSTKHLSNLEEKDIEKQKQECMKSRIDVWSIGWLLYYMCTGHHPSRDAWTRKVGLSERDLCDVPLECRDIVRMCVEPNISRRANLCDVKRVIDIKLQRLMFVKGVSLLKSNREEAFFLLDRSVGIQTWIGSSNVAGAAATTAQNDKSSEEDLQGTKRELKEESMGLNEKIRLALACLPLVVVRRVEWEAAGRYLKMNDLEMQEIRRVLVNGKWSKADVGQEMEAVRYLEEHASEGVSSAQSALGWIYRWGACGVKKDVKRAMCLWQEAVESGSDAEACNGLGLLYHHGRDNIEVDGKKGQKYYEMAVEQGYTAAAVNLGVMFHDGAGEVKADGKLARRYYEIGCRDGDAVAANNLGLLFQHGAAGVAADAVSARAAYETAILREERHHACRNLAELLWEGGEGVVRNGNKALGYFALAINHGDACSSAVAISRLRQLVAAGQHECDLMDRKDEMDRKVATDKAKQSVDELERLDSSLNRARQILYDFDNRRSN